MEDDTQLDLKPGIYKYDSSYRSNHVDVRDLVGMTGKLYVKVIAKSGSALVDYYGIGSEKFGAGGLWDAIVPITASSEDGQNFFQPFTTALIELRLNRDPKRFTADRVKLCYFASGDRTAAFSIVPSATRTPRMRLVF